MKNKKGFTLIELLAVIVVLAIILVIAGTSVIGNIRTSKEKAKYIAAKEIVSIAEAYMEAEPSKVSSNCVFVEDMVGDGYLESDVTNPKTGKNISNSIDLNGHQVCKGDYTAQTDYAPNGNTYTFDGYKYEFN